MEKIALELLNETYFKVHCSYEQALELFEYFECFAENYWFHPKYKAGFWNGKISFYDIHESTLPIGLFRLFKNFVKKFRYEPIYAFDKEDLVNEISDKEFDEFYKIVFKDSKYFPREYQDRSIRKGLRLKRGIIESPTGSGKSLIIYCLIRFAMATSDGNILLVVPNVDLTNQMFGDFEEYGWTNADSEVSILYSGSSRYNANKRILISTWQSIHRKKQNFFEQFGSIIIDEVHGVGSSVSIQSILKKCVNAEYRLGLTGTMPESLLDKYNIHGYIGPKLIQIETYKLIEKGYLSDIKIGNLFLQYPKDDVENNKGRSYQDELDWIIKNKNRNKVFKYIINHINTNDNVLILCHRIEHLDSIYDYLNEMDGKHVFKISGKTDPEKRKEIRHFTEKNDGVIIVATFGTMSTGINIKKLHHVILGSSYKSKIKILQSIGRGLRLHESKKRLRVWDIIDDLRYVNNRRRVSRNYIFKHFEQRLKYYKEKKFNYVNRKIKLIDL